MQSQADIERVAKTLLESHGLSLVSCKNLQTLWAGYGHICAIDVDRIDATTEKSTPYILKYISPPVRLSQEDDEGHLRKIISYQVEQHFYSNLAPEMPKNVAVASCLASIDSHTTTGNTTAMILTDLRTEFPIAGEKCRELNQKQIYSAIDWLASFHGYWWTASQRLTREKLRMPPLDELRRIKKEDTTMLASSTGVWLNGSYTYLATRRSEYADLIEDTYSEWSTKLCRPVLKNGESIVEGAARYLSPTIDGKSPASAYETLIHGDVKSENLFTTKKGDAVAFFDFQYVGLGLGVCDLAKLFTCSLPRVMLSDGAHDGRMHSNEELLLRRYLTQLEKASGKHYEWAVFKRHWETALVDWLRFQASWGFWGNTEWLEARVRTILEDQAWLQWLDSVTEL